MLIENVGNLVCPAEFDVGEDARAMVYAITEGEEKPLKYPVMFRSCGLVVVNKVDLLPYLGFDMDGFLGNLRKVSPAAEVMLVSARTGEGIDAWCDWPARPAGHRPARVCRWPPSGIPRPVLPAFLFTRPFGGCRERRRRAGGRA